MRIALTGTPGVGKTTLAAEAARHGWQVVDVKAWAQESGAVVGHDVEQGADEVDTDLLRVPPDDGSPVLYEGHLSHHLPLDAAWVVRLDPLVLRSRLLARGYPQWKVEENVEAEAMDLILQEALPAFPRLIQRDGTRRSPQELLAAFVEAGSDRLKAPDVEAVDWSHRLL